MIATYDYVLELKSKIDISAFELWTLRGAHIFLAIHQNNTLSDTQKQPPTHLALGHPPPPSADGPAGTQRTQQHNHYAFGRSRAVSVSIEMTGLFNKREKYSRARTLAGCMDAHC